MNSHGQINSWNHKLYTTSDGLPSNEIRNCIQDKEGFIWIATASGLCRFDGDEFVTLLNKPGDSTSIPSDFTRHISIIPDGRILVSTGKGLYVMDAKSRQGFTMHLYTRKGWEALEDNVNQILVDSLHNHILIFTSAAVHVFDLNMQQVKSVTYYAGDTNASELGDFALNPVLLYNGDVLFLNRITQQLGIFTVADMKIKNLHDLPLNPYHKLTERYLPNLFSVDSAANVWIHYEYTDSLFCIKPTGELLYWPLKEKYSWVQMINFASVNRMLWSTTINGKPHVAEFSQTEILKNQGHTFSYLSKSGFEGISGKLFVDKQRNWWLCCTEGLYYIRSNHEALQTINLPLPYRNSSIWQYVTAIKNTDAEHLLITTKYEHCYLYNTKLNTVSSYLDTVPLNESVKYSMEKIAEVENQKFLILGNISFTWLNKAIIKGFAPQNKFEAYYNKQRAMSLCTDKDGVQWVSFENLGLTKWNDKTKEIKNFVPGKALLMPHFTGMTADNRNELWLININQPGLLKFSKKEVFEVIHNNKNNLRFYKSLKFIEAGDNGMLYISHEGGLLIYNSLKDSVQNITMFDGLPSSIILGLFYYHHYLFISTPNGWVIMNADNYTMKILKQDDGIRENITTEGYCLDSSNGVLYVGGKGTVYKANLSELLQSPIHSSIVINDLKINDKVIRGVQNPLLLRHDENNISLSVSSIDFYSGINKKYFYRITVNNKVSGWESNKSSKKFSFINLSPGNYKIEIKSKTANNEWSVNTASFSFIIAAPWYNTWWFYLLCIAAVTSLIYALFRYRINQVSKMQRMQQRISSDLHDDIGASLTSINILSQLSQQQKIDDTSRNEYLKKINEQTLEVTNALRDIVWSINPKNDKIELILSRMKRYASELLESKNIDYHFEHNIKNGDEISDAVTRQNLYLIFKEAVNNLAKYSQATNANIAMRKESTMLLLEIKDNGNGFDTNTVKKGNGIENMQRRAADIHAVFHIRSSAGSGTHISLQVPL